MTWKKRVIEMKMHAKPLEREERPTPHQPHHTPHSLSTQARWSE